MSDKEILDPDMIQALLERHEVFANVAELHGVIAGMFCGGSKFSSEDWLAPISDFYNQGVDFPEAVEEQIRLIYRQTWQNLIDDDMPFTPLMPDDDEALNVRSAALVAWTQAFLLGFGLNKSVLKDASDEINEAVTDFAEICKMTSDLDDNEENENAFFEVHEYVRISAMMCFTDLGDNPNKSKDKITLH
jgi:yecA family protein